MKCYTIRKHKHRSGIRIAPILQFRNEYRYRFMFGESCYYEPKEEDDYDINKLCGVSFGLHHKNSVRIGWRPDKRNNRIELLSYYYNNGKRSFRSICIVPIGQTSIGTINIDYESNIISVKVDSSSGSSKVWFDFQFDKKLWWGYYLFPYFGGNKKSPKNMQIYLERTK